jgi:pentatricopeptide repeat protein
MNAKFPTLVFALVALSACAQTPAAPRVKEGGANDSAAKAAMSVKKEEVKSALTPELLYQFLLGEIAGQRGDLALAKEAYVDLARKTRDARIARRAAEISTFAQDGSKAAEMANLWTDLEPDSARARQYLASTLIRNGRLSEAKPHLEAWLRTKDRPVAESFQKLHGLLARHKDKMAVLATVKSLAAAYPAVPEAHLAVAQSALDAGQSAQALTALDEALKLKPDWEVAALLKGQALGGSGDEAQLNYWRDFTALNANAERVWLAYAKGLARVGRFTEARKAFDEMIRRSPENPDLRFAAGLVAVQMNDMEEAERYLNEAHERGYADAGLIKSYLGQVNEGLQRYEKALTWYLDVALGEQYLQARLKAAMVLGKLGRIDEARALLAKLDTTEEADRSMIVQADAQLLRDAKRFEEAYDVLSKALAKTPDAGDLLYDRAMVAERLNKLDQLEADLRRLIVLEPDHAHAYNALGYTFIDRTTRIDEGIALLEKALKLRPDDPFILDSMGWAKFKAGRLTEAVEYLKRAYGMRTDPEIAAHLGEALWAAGKHDEARAIWQGSLKEHPENEVLKETAARFAK